MSGKLPNPWHGLGSCQCLLPAAQLEHGVGQQFLVGGHGGCVGHRAALCLCPQFLHGSAGARCEIGAQRKMGKPLLKALMK